MRRLRSSDETTARRRPLRTARPAAAASSAFAAHVFVAFAFAALTCASLPGSVHAACQVDSTELPVRMVGSRAVSTVTINGQTVPLTIDSGAFFSTLTDAAAGQLNLRLRQNFNLRVYGLTGRMDVQTTVVDRLGLFKGEIPRAEFIVGVSEPGAGTMGLLGRNILSISDTEYDLAHGAIRFMVPTRDCKDQNMAYWAGSTPVTEVELLTERGKLPPIRAHVRLNGVELVALFDTGATTIVSERAARRVGVAEADWKPAGTFTGGGSGRGRLSTATFDRFEIGGEVIHNNRLMVGDLQLDDADLLLGIDFFLSHRIYVARDRDTMFITYNGGTVFTLDRNAATRTTDAKNAANAAQAASAAAGTAANAVASSAANAPAGPAASAAVEPPAVDDANATADQLARRGAASAARSDYASALADLDRACALEPTVAALFAQRGEVQLALRHPAKAREDFDHALQLDPTQNDALMRRAALRLAKDRDGALADLDALDRTLPAQSPLRLAMSALYTTLEQPAKTLAQLDRWLAAHPNDSARGSALNRRCWARVMLGSELTRAIDDCDEALATDRNNAAYLDTRGWAWLRFGRLDKALGDFDRSVQARPAAWSLYGLGVTKTRMGDPAAGELALAAARKLQADIDARVAKTGVLPDAPPAPRSTD